MAKEMELPGPVPVSIVICESIAKDLATERLHLVGLMTGVTAGHFPASYSFAVHATVANVREDMVAFFEIVDSEGEVVERSDDLALMRPESFLEEATAATFFRDVTFWHPGDYFVRFWGNRQVIMDKRLRVRRDSDRD